MNLTQFKESLGADIPPHNLTLLQKALWQDGKGNWEEAHRLVQDEAGPGAALVHAYLHRKEGDIWNADYWYRRASRKRPSVSLEQEWQDLVMAFENEQTG